MTPEKNTKLDPNKMQFLTMHQFAEKNPWPNVLGLREIYAKRHLNGMADAFIRHGRRIIVNEEAFFDLFKKIKCP